MILEKLYKCFYKLQHCDINFRSSCLFLMVSNLVGTCHLIPRELTLIVYKQIYLYFKINKIQLGSNDVWSDQKFKMKMVSVLCMKFVICIFFYQICLLNLRKSDKNLKKLKWLRLWHTSKYILLRMLLKTKSYSTQLFTTICQIWYDLQKYPFNSFEI